MNTDSNGKLSRRKHKLAASFGFAFKGITFTVRNERNMQIHLGLSTGVLLAGFILGLTRVEWLFVIFAIGGMLALEIVNTAIEKAVDLASQEYHPLAKQAKDIAAGAVLIFAFICVLVGLIIFVPKLADIIN
ncbi:diacylglycerol kinase family protein [Bacillus sp. T33-2]|uniref:diacylglycerol kinase family protein n=1 Tax=Bacillus sp. T33-2 TaxID=2054168 RepID=UPI000C76F1C4|nr:diacylglycerol kinase family protein [Bacillus sp. T33-2]PLR93826.1 diacylglycerol kinase [Bacillus sp. T33-2]